MTTTTTAALLSTEGPAQDFDYDIGATAKERNAILDEVHETWAQIRALAETQDPKQVFWDKRDPFVGVTVSTVSTAISARKCGNIGRWCDRLVTTNHDGVDDSRIDPK